MKCLVIDDDQIQRRLVEYYIQRTEFLNLEGSFGLAVDAIDFIHKNEVDLLFLDVEMPVMSGIEFIQNVSVKCPVVLVTSKENYALDGFENNVIDYLLKPVEYSRFLRAVGKAASMKPQKQQTEEDTKSEIFVKTNSVIEKVSLSEILWVEAAVDYIQIIKPDKKLLVYGTLKEMEKRLPAKDFIRVHRSFLVRKDKIQKIDKNKIVISGQDVPLSKTYKETVLSTLNVI